MRMFAAANAVRSSDTGRLRLALEFEQVMLSKWVWRLWAYSKRCNDYNKPVLMQSEYSGAGPSPRCRNWKGLHRQGVDGRVSVLVPPENNTN